jgi:CheY-like chemotaxis protein
MTEGVGASARGRRRALGETVRDTASAVSTRTTEGVEILDPLGRDFRIVDGSIKDQSGVGAKVMNIQTGRVRDDRTPFFPLVASEWRSSTPSSHPRAKAMCERRRSGRVDSSGTVVVHGEVPIRARIIDLAIGGVRVRVDPTVAQPSIGTQVRIDLRLDGHGCWTRLLGRILRGSRTGSDELVIKLHDFPARFEDLVQDELLASVECAQTPHVLVVDADPLRRELVAAAFQEIGFLAMKASSALEAIAGVDESRLHLWAVVIADTDLDPRAEDLRAFLAAAYPCVPQIVVGVRGRPRRSATCLSVDHIPDLALQAHRLVAWEDPIVYQ